MNGIPRMKKAALEGRAIEEGCALETELAAKTAECAGLAAQVIWVFDIDGPPIYKQGNEKLHETMSVVTAQEVQHMANTIKRYRDKYGDLSE